MVDFYVCKCGTMVNDTNAADSYFPKRLCPECSYNHFKALVENKIWNADKQTLDYLLLFFQDYEQAKKYNWTENDCSCFVRLIQQNQKNFIPLSKILTQGAI